MILFRGSALPLLIALGLAACGGQEPAPIVPAAVVVSTPAPVAATPEPSAVEAPRPIETARQAPMGSVKAGNQRALNGVVVPFAHYLNAMHARLHPHFADDALGKLGALPKTDPLNDPKLMTRVEIVIDGTSGAIIRVGVVAPSGNTAFDVLAVDAVQKAGPFAAPAPELRSVDGNVYVHWQFSRDEVFACSTMHVHPYLLSSVTGT